MKPVTDPPVSVLSIPPHEWFTGPSASLMGTLYFGETVRDRERRNALEDAAKAGNLKCVTSQAGEGRPTKVRFAKIPPSGGRATEQSPGKFSIGLFIDDELAISLEPSAFVEAFLAVVPRWFWKPKDERP